MKGQHRRHQRVPPSKALLVLLVAFWVGFRNLWALLSPLTQLCEHILALTPSSKHFTIRRVQHLHILRFQST